MERIWASGAATADDVRTALASSHPMKESTVRTVLRRLESKGYLSHDVVGRTYHYRPAVAKESVGARALRQIADRFFGGSVEQLVVGMVDNEVIDPSELEALAKRIAKAKRTRGSR